jgi:hypothetical protein
MGATRTALYVIGAVLELVGILLVAWPDLLPYGARSSRWVRRRTRRTVDQVRLVVGRPRAQVVHVAGIDSAQAFGSASVSAIVSVNEEASPDERVEYLLRREREAQERLNAHDDRLRSIEERVPKQLEELRAESEEHVAKELTSAEWQYRPLRFIGAVALAAGLALTTTAQLA